MSNTSKYRGAAWIGFSIALATQTLVCPSAVAQEEDKPMPQPMFDEQNNQTAKTVATQGLIGKSGFAPLVPQFQLTAATGETEASMSISYALDGTPHLGGKYRTSISDRFTLKAAAPLSKNGPTSVFSYTNLTDGANITLAWTRFSSRFPNDPANIRKTRAIAASAVNKCVRKVVDDFGNENAENAIISTKYLARYSEILANPTYRQNYALIIGAIPALESKSDLAGLAKHVQSLCLVGYSEKSPGDDNALIGLYAEDQLQAWRDSAFGKKPLVFVGIEGAVGQKKYEFLDIPTFTEGSDGKTSYGASAYVGLIGHDGTWSIKAKGSYSKKYQAQDETTICQPVPGGAQTKCLTGAGGRPVDKESSKVSLELRRLLELGTMGLKIGIAPDVTYDVGDDEYSIDLPIYLAPDKDGNLTGGIRVGYRSDMNDFGIGLFVGLPFSALGF